MKNVFMTTAMPLTDLSVKESVIWSFIKLHTPESIYGPAHKVARKLRKRNEQKIHTVFSTLHSI